jgi:hypothetical protein
MCGGGGGGGGGQTEYVWNDETKPYWQGSLSQAGQLAGQPYQPYTGQRIANINQDQTDAMGNIRLYASDPTYGVQDPNQAQNAGINQEKATLEGQYLQSDPFATYQNDYSGTSSPYFQNTLNQGLDDITRSYQQGTAADTTRMFNQAGAFGGSAYQNAVSANQYNLGKQLGNYTQGMMNDQYNRSAQLQEQDLTRGSDAYQQERGRMIGALSPTQNEQNLALGRANAQLSVGDAQRSYNQDLLNQNYNDFTQAQQYPYNELDFLTGLISRSQGGMSPNSTTTTSGYSASPFSALVGAGLLGKAAGLYGS